jgi:hypothetical protein
MYFLGEEREKNEITIEDKPPTIYQHVSHREKKDAIMFSKRQWKVILDRRKTSSRWHGQHQLDGA